MSRYPSRDVAESDNLPVWTGKPGQYEVWFLTMSDGARGYWIRYTLLAPHSGPPEARLWFACFDRADPKATFGVNRAVPLEDLRSGPGELEVHFGGGVLKSGHARGAISGGGREVSWLLDFETGGETYRLLPDALYRGGLAPTKPFSPNVETTFSGRISIDGHTHPVTSMPGQQGHLYGTKHAERWAWAHCSAFDDRDAVLQAICAQGRRGPMTTPFTTFAGLRWRGGWLRFRGVARRRPFWLGGWRIDLSNKRYRLTGRVAGDPSFMVQAEYHDPDGTPRYCHNTEVASSRFVLVERGGAGFEEADVLTSEGSTHAEWAGRTPAPGEFAPHVPA
jgi:hypothetical protein